MRHLEGLRSAVPELFQLTGELLLVDETQHLETFADELCHSNYSITLLEESRARRAQVAVSGLFTRVLEGTPRSIAAIASLVGLQWDVTVWWCISRGSAWGAGAEGLQNLKIVTRKLVVVVVQVEGSTGSKRVIRDLKTRGFEVSREGPLLVARWYGTHYKGVELPPEPVGPPMPIPASLSGPEPTGPPEPIHAPVEPEPVIEPKQADDSVVATLVTAVVVNFNTAALTTIAVESLRHFYPQLPIQLVDNHSFPAASKQIKQLAQKHSIQATFHETNIGHGPAMHQAIQASTTPFILTFDSDCEVLQRGFIEAMLRLFNADPNLYATGWLRIVDRLSGVATNRAASTINNATLCRYVHPCCGLYHRARYLELPPFEHQGAPCLPNMREAEKLYHLTEYNWQGFVRHLGAGTRRRYSGRWDPESSETPKRWKATENYPI